MPKSTVGPEVIDAPSTAVAVTSPQRSVQQYAAPVRDDSWDDVDSSVFLVPRLSIVQPASRRDGAEDHAGHLFRSTDRKYFDKLDVVILKMEPNNTLWGATDSKVPECTSNNGRTGTVYGNCQTCQFNRFGTSPESIALNQRLEKGENLKQCHVGGFNFIVATPEDDEVALLGVHGKNIAPMRRLVSSLRTKGLPMYGAPVSLATTGEKNNRGRYYVLTPEVGQKFTPDQLIEWRSRFNALRGMNVTDVGPESGETAYSDPMTEDEGLAF